MASDGNLSKLPDNLLTLLTRKQNHVKLPLFVADMIAATDMLVSAAEQNDFTRFKGAIDSLAESRNAIVSLVTKA